MILLFWIQDRTTLPFHYATLVSQMLLSPYGLQTALFILSFSAMGKSSISSNEGTERPSQSPELGLYLPWFKHLIKPALQLPQK